MRTVDALRRSGIGVRPDQTILEAAIIMEQSGVGALAVIDGTELVGIVTDRDLARRALAHEMAPDARVDGVMSSPVVTIGAEADVHQVFGLFRTHGVRRLAVLQAGRFVGMLTLDDMLVDLAGDLFDLSRPVSAQVEHAQRNGLLPATA